MRTENRPRPPNTDRNESPQIPEETISMADKALTPDVALCTNCSNAVSFFSKSCPQCKEEFTEKYLAFLCPECAGIIRLGTPACPRCGKRVKGPEGREEKTPFVERSAAKPETSQSPPPSEQGAPIPEIDVLNQIFQGLFHQLRKKIELLNNIVDQARRRINALQVAESEVELRERDALERQVDEIAEEREELLHFERGMRQVEEIYRRLVDQVEGKLPPVVRDRYGLDAEMDGLRRQLSSKEEEVQRKEKERLALVRRLSEKEAVAPQTGGGSREELISVGQSAGEVSVSSASGELRDLQLRINELEEHVEKLQEEKARTFEEIRNVLSSLDQLMEKLPADEVDQFSRSPMFALYEKVLARYGL